jgi:hypothetical protein
MGKNMREYKTSYRWDKYTKSSGMTKNDQSSQAKALKRKKVYSINKLNKQKLQIA